MIERINWMRARQKNRWRAVVEGTLDKLIEGHNTNQTALIAQDTVWEDIRRQTEALSKLTERVEAIEAKAQGKGYYPPGIVERLEKLSGEIGKMADKVEDIDDTLYCHDNRIKALEDDKSTIALANEIIDTYRAAWEQLAEGESGRADSNDEPNEPLTSQLPIDLSNYCGKYRPAQDVPCKMCGGTGQDDPPPGKYHGLCPRCGGNGKEPPAQGSYICDNCGHDFGTYIARGERCCPDRKPVWHQAQTVGKPAEVPTSSAAEKPPTSTAIEEPKPYPEGAENQSGTLKACQCGGTPYVSRMDDGKCRICCSCCGMQTALYLTEKRAREVWNCRPIEDELRQKLADMQIEYDRSEREREGAVDEIDTLKETNRLLRVEVKRVGAMPSCDPTACWHVHAREELAKENTALKAENERLEAMKDKWEPAYHNAEADLAAAQAKIERVRGELTNQYAQYPVRCNAALAALDE